MIKADILCQAQFYDLDPMHVVWHGNYAKFFELARCALLEKIGYSYTDMAASGHVWPVVELSVKYIGPIVLAQNIRVEASLAEYENRLRITYKIFDVQTGKTLTKGQTTQLAVKADSKELCFESPTDLIHRVKALLP